MSSTLLLEKNEMARILDRLASQVLERHARCENVMLVGIQRRGADLARRLGALIEARLGAPVPLGTLDINLYRDDWTSLEGKPHIGQSNIPGSVDERVILLVDDSMMNRMMLAGILGEDYRRITGFSPKTSFCAANRLSCVSTATASLWFLA